LAWVLKRGGPEVRVYRPEVRVYGPEVRVCRPEVRVYRPEVPVNGPEVRVYGPEVVSERTYCSLLDKAELLAEAVNVGLVQLLRESGIVLQEEFQRLQIDTLYI
jgi:hypothetical protein